MKRIPRWIGVVAFWLAWPVLWLHLRRTHRTRLLLICGNEFLALKDWLGTGKWSLPGGGLHRGENVIDGLLREVKEETGIVLEAHAIHHLFDTIGTHLGLHFKYSAFVCTTGAKPEVHIQEKEISTYAWLSLENPGTELSYNTSEVLRRWRAQS